MDARTPYGRQDGRTNGRTNEWMHGWMDGWMHTISTINEISTELVWSPPDKKNNIDSYLAITQ